MGTSDFLTVAEWRRDWNLSKGLAYRLIKEGRVPHLRCGRKILVLRRGLERMMADALATRHGD